jgi:hypothetical protein
LLQGGLAFCNDRFVALAFGEFDQLDLVGEFFLQSFDVADLALETLSFPHQLLRPLRRRPEFGVFGGGVQFGKAGSGGIPVKDASSAG